MSRIAWKIDPSVRKSTGCAGACGVAQLEDVEHRGSIRSRWPSMPVGLNTSTISSSRLGGDAAA